MRHRTWFAALAVAAALNTGIAPGPIDVTVEVPGNDPAPSSPGDDAPVGAPEPATPEPLPRTGAPAARFVLWALTLLALGSAVLRTSRNRPDQGETR